MTTPVRTGATTRPADDAAARPSVRRQVVLGALGAGALAVAGLLLLTGGSETPDAALATAAVAGAPPAASAPASPGPGAPSTAADDRAARSGRDPFTPLHVTTVPGAPAAVAPAAVVVPTPAVALPGSAGAPAPAVPVPSASDSPGQRTLSLLAVEGAGERRTAVFTLDATTLRTQVGSSFGPGAALLLLSLQQEPDGGQWAAIVQHGTGDPVEVTTGRHAHLP